MIDRSKKLPAFFYQTSNGSEPVRDWLLDLRQKIGSWPGVTFRKSSSVGRSGCHIAVASATAYGKCAAT
jgi:hypothetical protein